MFYQVSMSCQVCGSSFPYSTECKAHLETVLREAREACPYCGAQMSPQVAEIREAQDMSRPSPVTKPSDSSLYWHFHQVARSQVGV